MGAPVALHWNLAAGFAGSAWAALVAIAFVPVYIHYLGPQGWGAIGFFVTLQGWLSIVDGGFSSAFNREFAALRAGLREERATANLLRSTELLYAVLGVAMAALLAGSSDWLATRWLNAEPPDAAGVAAALRWLGVAIALQWLASLYRQALLGLERQVVPHLTAAAAATVRAAATMAALAWIAPTLTIFVAVQLCLAALEMLALRAYLRHRLPGLRAGKWARGSLAQARRFGAGLAGITLLAIVLTQGDKLLLSTLLPLDQFGFVMLAVTVAGCLSLGATPVFLLSYPRLSALAATGDEAAFAREYERWSQWLAVLVLPLAALVILFAQDLLATWTGNAALASAVSPLLALWSAGTGLNALMHVPYAAQLAHGWTRLTLGLNAAAVALLAPLTLWLVPRHGPPAAGWIWVAINAFYVIVAVQLMHRRILRGHAAAWYARSLLVPGAAAFGVVGAVSAWRHLHAGLSGPALAAMFAFALAAGFLAAVLATPHPRAFVVQWLRTGR